MLHKEYAAHSLLRSLRRRTAGEHDLSTADIVHMFGSEWGLGPRTLLELLELAHAEEERLAERMRRGS